MPFQSCPVSEDVVQEAFLAAPPAISSQILDMRVQFPVWMSDIFDVEEWAPGQGNLIQQLIFKDTLPVVERGMNKWRKVEDNTGCAPGKGPDCGYNWTTFGGHAFDRTVTEFMHREFRTDTYCVKAIETTLEFKEIFGKIVEGLFRKTQFFKEMNIGHNVLTGLAKKYVVDAAGAHPNPHNIYAYRNIGTARISNLNVTLLEFFYERLRRMSSVLPYDVIDGAPVFALEASAQVLNGMYKYDVNLREDIRYSSMANDLVNKYNIMSTIRGMFWPVAIQYPRRFIIVAGEPVEVLPFVNNVPAEVGVYTDENPAYEDATHEEVTIHGQNPFKIFTQGTVQTLGGNTSFGPEDSFMNTWQWINIKTEADPFGRSGYFATAAKMAVSPQYSEGIFGILVERPSIRLMAMYNPEPTCPPATVTCTNLVPTVTCPCPAITEVRAHPITPNNWFVTFASPVTGSNGGTVALALDNDGSVNGTLVGNYTAAYAVQLALPAGFDISGFGRVQGIYCDSNLGCSARVLAINDCRSGQANQFDIILSNPIKAQTAAQLLTACLGDGTQTTLYIVAVDPTQNRYTVRYATGSGPTDDPTGAGSTALNAGFVCNRNGVRKVCVPPTTDATCPACDVADGVCSGAQA